MNNKNPIKPKNTCNRRNLSSTNGVRRLQTGHWSDCEPASSYHPRATTVGRMHAQKPENTCRCCDPSSVQSEPN